MRLALVTGTSSGIGEAVAEDLLRRGWRVMGISRRAGALNHSAYTHLRADLADLDSLPARMEAEVGPTLRDGGVGRVALVNNAAEPGLLGPVEDIDPKAMLEVFAVNVAAPTWLMGWVVRRSPVGAAVRIVNVLSGAGVRPFPGLGTYGSAKAALRMTGMVLVAELERGHGPEGARRDVTVLAYRPAPVDTPMQEKARASSPDVFPLLETFTRWATEGELLHPRVPAGEIASYLEGDGYPGFADCRSGELGMLGRAEPTREPIGPRRT